MHDWEGCTIAVGCEIGFPQVPKKPRIPAARWHESLAPTSAKTPEDENRDNSVWFCFEHPGMITNCNGPEHAVPA